MRVPFFSVVYFSRGALPLKRVRKGTTGGPSLGNQVMVKTMGEAQTGRPWAPWPRIHVTEGRGKVPWHRRKLQKAHAHRLMEAAREFGSGQKGKPVLLRSARSRIILHMTSRLRAPSCKAARLSQLRWALASFTSCFVLPTHWSILN